MATWSRLRRSPREKVFPQTGLRRIFLAASALGLYLTAFFDPSERPAERFRTTLIVLGFDVAFLCLFWVPAIRVGPRYLRIIGVLRCRRIPWEAVRGLGMDPAAPKLNALDSAGGSESVELADGRWVGFGISPSAKMDKTGHWESAQDAIMKAREARQAGATDSGEFEPAQMATRPYLGWAQLLTLVALYGIAYGIAVLRWRG